MLDHLRQKSILVQDLPHLLLFAHCRVLLLRDHRLVCCPAVGEAMPPLWNCRDQSNEFEDTRWREWLLGDLDSKRIGDSIGDGGWCADCTAFAYPAEVDGTDRGRLQVLNLDRRDLHRRRYEIVHKSCGQELPVLIVDGVLVEDASNTLGGPAAHLPLDDGRVDHRPAVLNDEVARNIYLAGLWIHLNPAAMRCLGVS